MQVIISWRSPKKNFSSTNTKATSFIPPSSPEKILHRPGTSLIRNGPPLILDDFSSTLFQIPQILLQIVHTHRFRLCEHSWVKTRSFRILSKHQWHNMKRFQYQHRNIVLRQLLHQIHTYEKSTQVPFCQFWIAWIFCQKRATSSSLAWPLLF